MYTKNQFYLLLQVQLLQKLQFIKFLIKLHLTKVTTFFILNNDQK